MRHVSKRSRRWLILGTLIVAVGLGGAVFWQGATGQDRTSTGVSRAIVQAESLSQAFRAASHAVQPTVVMISSITKAQRIELPRGMRPGGNPFRGTPFEDFFDDELPGFRGFAQIPPRQGVGSGVIIDPKGVVLTNNHVVEGADKVLIELADGRQFEATDIRTDPRSDLAVLRVKAKEPLPAAVLGDSDNLEIGDWVLAIGNPFELSGTVSAGIISGKGRSLAKGGRAKFLQTDAAINPGNSGGPLVDLKGQVIGINTAIASRTGGYQGIGFAIPINLAKWVTGQLIASGTVQRAYLGVQIGEVDNDLAAKLGVARNQGVVVTEVFANSPARAAGFKEGDVITAVDGRAVDDPRTLQEIVERSSAGSRQAVDVIRDGKPMKLQVVVKPLPSDFDVASTPSLRHDDSNGDSSSVKKSKMLGLEVAELTEDLAERLGFRGSAGVVITGIEPDGVAAEEGIRAGMLILRVGKTPVNSVTEFEAALKGENLSDGVLLLIRTSRGNRFVVLRSS